MNETRQVCDDLVTEAQVLHDFLKTLAPSDWERETGFMSWTPWDVVAHLHFFDEVSLLALEGREPFEARSKELMKLMGSKGNKEIAREHFAGVGPDALLERWMTTCKDMSAKLGACDPKHRLPWFGPDMGVRMFTTARFMETWAHGQEVYDLKGATREVTDRIQHIVAIGVRTFGWTFVNRGMDVPGDPPYVRLEAPSGAIWEYNTPSEDECIHGSALDFAHVVTQGRNVADTQLRVKGDVARQWMSIAQCFAGGPVDPPKPGERTGK